MVPPDGGRLEPAGRAEPGDAQTREFHPGRVQLLEIVIKARQGDRGEVANDGGQGVGEFVETRHGVHPNETVERVGAPGGVGFAHDSPMTALAFPQDDFRSVGRAHSCLLALVANHGGHLGVDFAPGPSGLLPG